MRRHRIPSQGHVYFLLIAVLVSVGCGKKHHDDGAVDPADVRFDHLTGGFWLSADPAAPDSRSHVMQFIEASEARALYGGYEVPGVSTAVLGTAGLDDMLASFGEADPIMLLFPRGGGQVRNVYAVEVDDGVVRFSRLGESARNVQDGVLFEFGFSEPFEVPLARFVGEEELVFGAEANDFAQEYDWIADCRWTGRGGWVITLTNSFEVETVPRVASTLTRAGELVSFFEHKPGDISSQFWRNGACPVRSRSVLPIRTGNILVPWGERDAAVLYHDANGLAAGVVGPEVAERLAALDETVDGRIGAWRAVDDEMFVVLEQSERDSGSLWLPMQRTRVRNLTEVEPMPMPPIDEGLRDVVVRLLPDGRVFHYGVSDEAPSEREPILVAGVEGAAGAWEEVPLTGTTDEGLTVDLTSTDQRTSLWLDTEGRLTALTRASLVVSSVHPRRALDPDTYALVRLEGGRAEVYLLPSSVDGTYSPGLNDTVGEGDVDAAGTFVHFSQLNEPEPEDMRLVVLRWPVGGPPTVRAPITGIETPLEESGFFESGLFKGTPIATQRHLLLNEDGSALLSDGWARTFVRPADALFRPERYEVTLALADAPEGARLVSTHEPAVDCTDSCTLEVDRGTILGLRVQAPTGWIAVAPPEARCTEAQLDSGTCYVVAEQDREVRFSFRQTPIEDVTPGQPGGWFVDAAVGGGTAHAVRLATAGGVLPDGTEVTDASNQSPREVLSHWSGTGFDWLRVVEHDLPLRTYRFAADGDLVALYETTGSRRSYDDPQLGEVALQDGDRLVMRLDGATGETLSARAIPIPGALAVRAEGVDAAGRLFVVAESLRTETDVNTGLSFVTDERVLVRWDTDGAASIVSSGPIARGGVTHILPVGDATIVLSGAEGGVRREIVRANGSIARDDVLPMTRSGAPLSTDDLLVVPTPDELLVAFLADGDVVVDDTTLPGTTSAVIVFALDAQGAANDVVRLALDEPSYDELPRAVTRLADGHYMVVTNRERFGQEAFVIEGTGVVPIGPVNVRSGDLVGYESRALQALADGRVLWIARHWAGEVMRPFAMPGSFTALLVPDRLLHAQDLLQREEP